MSELAERARRERERAERNAAVGAAHAAAHDELRALLDLLEERVTDMERNDELTRGTLKALVDEYPLAAARHATADEGDDT